MSPPPPPTPTPANLCYDLTSVPPANFDGLMNGVTPFHDYFCNVHGSTYVQQFSALLRIDVGLGSNLNLSVNMQSSLGELSICVNWIK